MRIFITYLFLLIFTNLVAAQEVQRIDAESYTVNEKKTKNLTDQQEYCKRLQAGIDSRNAYTQTLVEEHAKCELEVNEVKKQPNPVKDEAQPSVVDISGNGGNINP